jgi:outer membrane lipoprotein-sorting protein
MTNRLNFTGMAILAFAVLGVLFTAAKASAQAGKIREIKQRMDTHNKGLNTLRAKVTMVKRSSQLGEEDTSIGKAIYAKRPGKDALVRIDWEKPAESLAVKDGEYVMYRPRLNIAYTGSVKSATKDTKGNSALAFMNMSKAQLDANYTVKLLNENVKLSTGVVTWHLEMTPIAKTSYKKAELWVDADGMPNQTMIVENNNDTTTVLLSDMQKNPQLKSSDFEIKVPKGTKVQKS